MYKTPITLAAVLALVACAPARQPTPPPQLPPGAGAGAERIQPPPVHALLGYRQELDLTSEQIEAIDSIGQWLFSSGDTIRARMNRDRQAPVRARRDPRAVEEALTALTGLQDRNRQATEGIKELLSDEQETKVCDLFQEDRYRSATRAGQPRARRAPGFDPGPPPPVWNWCRRPADEGETASSGS